MFIPAHTLSAWQPPAPTYDNLDPNVPEFVPVNLAGSGDGGDASDAEEVSESIPGMFVHFITKKKKNW